MKRLDNEFKRLVMVKYILRNLDVCNEEELEREVKDMKINRLLLIKLAEDISNCIDEWKDEEKTKPFFSLTTLGRIMGYYPNKGEIKFSNLDRIAKYIGCADWPDLVMVASEDIESKMLRDTKLEEENIMSVMDDGKSTHGSGLRRLLSHNLKKKQLVEVFYGKGRRLLLEKLDGIDRFIVRYCDSDVLKVGRSITIPFFFVGVNIVGLDICENGDPVNSYYKSGGVITTIRVINDLWRKSAV